jgi:phosphate:Na+ symporter
MTAASLIEALGGLGMFLLGMAVMTDGLRGAAGPSLRLMLARAARTPARGVAWGALVTLLVQSSSATTMTTIGLVSAGMLTFPQAVGVIFGANLGTTSTGWLVAFVGLKFSIQLLALPLLFAGALLHVLGRGRIMAIGGAAAGFGLLLAGLGGLQSGMAGLSAHVSPTDLPAVSGGTFIANALGVLSLIAAGAAITTVMQSSSAAMATTLSALAAGAMAPDQAAALVIGQNIGTTSSAILASIGATTAARRTALAHVLFNVITAAVAVPLFPLVAWAVDGAAGNWPPVVLIAAFHTGYNVLGICILLPAVGPFSRLVERAVPERGTRLAGRLDRSVRDVPAVAVEAARRTVAEVLVTIASRIAASLRAGAARVPEKLLDPGTIDDAHSALRETRGFLASLGGPIGSAVERARFAGTLDALDHVERLLTNAREITAGVDLAGSVRAMGARDQCVAALELAAGVTAPIARAGEPDAGGDPDPTVPWQALRRHAQDVHSTDHLHRQETLAELAQRGDGSAVDAAVQRIDAVRRMDRLAHHALRASERLVQPENHGESPIPAAEP